MRRLIVFLALCVVLLLPITPSLATRDPQKIVSSETSSSMAELLVFEAPRCGYCVLFRENFAPRYMQSKAQSQAPLRFFDVAAQNPDTVRLNTQITIVPTLVLMHNGIELARLEGYPAPELVFAMINSSLPKEP